MKISPSISIVIPAYNESRRLPATLQQIATYIEQATIPVLEIIVVDDGSTDGTAEVVDAFRKSHPLVQLIRNGTNRGKGYSVRRGMLAAKGEWVLFSDADLSTPIEELSRLLSVATDRNAAVVIGSRAVDRSMVEIRQSPLRQLAGMTFNLL